MVLNPHGPPPKSHFPPPPEAPHAHLQMEQLHQRSHQGIPQWTMDETHGSWLPPTNYQWIYSHQPPMDPIKTSSHQPLNPVLGPSWFLSTPWFLSESHCIISSTLLFNPDSSYQPQWFLSKSHSNTPWFLSKSHPISPLFQPQWLLPSMDLIIPINPHDHPSQSPQTLFLEAATCSLPSWWKITSCSF